jgi:hypothetical protein
MPEWIIPGYGQFVDIAGSDDLVDGYSESNRNTAIVLHSALYTKAGEETQPGTGILTRSHFWMLKVGSPTGNIVSTLYASDGGSPPKPTGAALATSVTVSAASLGASYTWIEFAFADAYEMADGTDYFIAIEYLGGDGSNYIAMGTDNSSPTHSGSAARYFASWETLETYDAIFHLFRQTYGVTSREWIIPGGQIHEVGEAAADLDASDYLENAVLDHTIDGATMAQPSGVYVSLHSGDPGETGTTEISGGSYSRTQASSWAAASGGSKSTSGAVAFTGLPATTINGYAIWDAVSSGNCLYTSHQLGTPITVASGDEIEFASGDITVTLD